MFLGKCIYFFKNDDISILFGIIPFRKDIEGYYGQLAGMESSLGGLNLIGMQVNDAEIKNTKGEGTTVIVRRKRNL